MCYICVIPHSFDHRLWYVKSSLIWTGSSISLFVDDLFPFYCYVFYFQFLPLNFSLSVGIEINNNPRSKFNFVIAFSDFSWSGLSPTVCSVLGFACRLQNVVKSTKRVENIMHISLLGWSCFLTLFHKTAFWVIWNLFTVNSVRPYLAQNRKSIDLRSCMKSTAFNAV